MKYENSEMNIKKQISENTLTETSENLSFITVIYEFGNTNINSQKLDSGRMRNKEVTSLETVRWEVTLADAREANNRKESRDLELGALHEQSGTWES